jgi:nitronate monooxygenase
MHTRITDLLGLKWPIIQAPMAGGPTTPALVAAVSSAGGLGSFGAAFNTGDQIRDLVAQARARSSGPIGVNLFVYEMPGVPDRAAVAAAVARLDPFWDELSIQRPIEVDPPFAPAFDDQFTAVLETRPELVSFHLGLPSPAHLAELAKLGVRTAASATTLAEARAVTEAGIDIVVAQGSEAGGHRGTFLGPAHDALIGTMALVRQIVVALPEMPLVAAGGIMDGSGIAAALALGADAAQLGTAFLPCPESGAPEPHKAALHHTRGDDGTRVTDVFSGRPARAVRNRLSEETMGLGALLAYPVQNKMTGPLRSAGARAGNPDVLSMWSGQAGRLARALPAAELVALLARETLEAVAALNKAVALSR